jgi:glycosyltransferase involved in cell wall biosynthesis
MERPSERLHCSFDTDSQTCGCPDALAERLHSPLAPSKIRGRTGPSNTRGVTMMDQLVGQPARTKTIFYGIPGLKIESRDNDQEAKRREIGITSNDFLVIGAGRLVEQKRPFEFLRIARELQIRVPSVRFLWVGDGELADEWKTAIARDGLAHVISHTGWREDVTPYLLAGDLLLHVAKYDGLPFAIIEAIAAGLPCGATSDLAREIPMLGVGATLPADDVDHLARGIQDAGVLASIGENGSKRYNRMLSASNMAEPFLNQRNAVLYDTPALLEQLVRKKTLVKLGTLW